MPKNRTDWDTQTHTQRCWCCCCYLNALTKPVSKSFPTPWLPFFFFLPPPSRTLLHVRFATLWERALRTTEQEIPSSYCKKLDKISLVCLYVSFCLGLRLYLYLYLSRGLNGVFEISIAHRKPSQGSHKGSSLKCVWRKAVDDEEVWESASDARDRQCASSPRSAALGPPSPTRTRSRARGRASGRAYYDPGKKKRKKTTTSRYTIPQRNGCPATAITPRSNCVLIRCLNIHLMLLSTIPITSLGISYSLFQRFSYTLSLYIVDFWRTWNNSFFLIFFLKNSSWILSKSLNKFSIF